MWPGRGVREERTTNREIAMQLSRFFTLTEMTRSDTATRLAIPNLPDEPALAGLKALCAAVLDPLREGTGAAIKVNSGYRGPQLNARIGGAKKSQHMEGEWMERYCATAPLPDESPASTRNTTPREAAKRKSAAKRQRPKVRKRK
jgi:hypothetical protein